MTDLTSGVTAPSLHVALVEPEIHWNTGNAGRTCLASGAQLHLIGPLGFSLAEREVRRAGLDYWPRVLPRLWPDWATFEAALPSLGDAWFFSAEAPKSYWEADFASSRSTVLIFGKESTGLDANLRQRYRDRLLGIPMANRAAEDGAAGVRSLNLSTSVAVAIYDVLRQRADAARGSGK